MALIFYKNVIDPSNITSISASTTSGSLTERLDIENLADRSILKRYEYSNSSWSGSITITVTLDDTVDGVECAAVLGCYRHIESGSNLRIQFKNAVNTVLYATGTPTVSRTRVINGETVRDTAWHFDAVDGVKKIEIIYDKEVGTDPALTTFPFIGVLYCGSLINLKIKPRSMKYQFGTQGKKIKTPGGQVYASKNNSYMRAMFQTTAKEGSGVVTDYFDLNYEASISEPIIFIPNTGEDILLYGTQEKTNSTAMILGNRGGSEGIYETTFQFEEEL